MNKIKFLYLVLHGQVRSDVADHVPAGGHQGYASLGALHSQARPMLTNLYGDIKTQTEGAPVGEVNAILFISTFYNFEEMNHVGWELNSNENCLFGDTESYCNFLKS